MKEFLNQNLCLEKNLRGFKKYISHQCKGKKYLTIWGKFKMDHHKISNALMDEEGEAGSIITPFFA